MSTESPRSKREASKPADPQNGDSRNRAASRATSETDTRTARWMGLVVTAILLAGGGLFSGCDLIGAGDETDGGPTMSLHLTDAPASSIQEANVVIRSIYLQGADDEGRDTLLSETTEPINLLELRDRTMELVKDDTLEPGTYSQLRLVLGKVELVTEGGTYTSNGTPGRGGGPGGGLNGPGSGSLICPSCSASGLKINLPDGGLTISEGADFQQTLILDFDVSQSFGHKAGRSGNWVMHPVITATNAGVSGTVEGRIDFASEGVLPDSCASAPMSVEEFEPLLRDTETDSVVKSATVQPDSSFGFRFVQPGTYATDYADTVDVGSQDSVMVFEAGPSSAEIDVSSGETASLDYEVTSASCVAAQ